MSLALYLAHLGTPGQALEEGRSPPYVMKPREQGLHCLFRCFLLGMLSMAGAEEGLGMRAMAEAEVIHLH